MLSLMRASEHILLALLFLSITLNSVAFPDEVWVEGIGQADMSGKSAEQAKEEALNKAREDAAAKVSGFDVFAEDFRLIKEENKQLSDIYSRFTKLRTQARILNEEILGWEQISYSPPDSQSPPIPGYRVRLKIKAFKEKEQPSFSVSLALNKNTFVENEELILTVKSSKDCYITILDLMSDGNVVVVFPNPLHKNNHIKAGQPFVYPNSQQRNQIIHLRASLRRGMDKDDFEVMWVIATLNPVEFLSKEYRLAEESQSPQGWIPLSYLSLVELNRQIITISTDQRAEYFAQYHIVKR